MSQIRIFLFFFFSCAPNGGLSNPNSANTCWWISHKGCMLICFAWYCIMSDVRQVRPVWWHWSTLIQCRVVSHVGLGGSGLAGQKLGKFVEGWTRDTQDSEGWTLGVRGTPNRRDMSADTWLWGHQTKETCQAGTLDTVFQGFEKTAKKPWCFHSGLHVSLWDQQCDRQRVTCRELYFYTIKKMQMQLHCTEFFNQSTAFVNLKAGVVSGVPLTLCSISEWRRKMGWDVWGGWDGTGLDWETSWRCAALYTVWKILTDW